MPDKAIIIGGGAFGRELLSWARAHKDGAPAFDIVGYVDDAGDLMAPHGGNRLGYLGSIERLEAADASLLIAIGEPATKRRITQQLEMRGARFATLIHPSAVVADTATLAPGVVIGPHAYVGTEARLDRLVCVNSLSGIGHDAVLGAFCTISSQVDITGGVQLGEEVFVGSGARILPKVRVGATARIGAGSIVVRTVKEGQSLFGAPARTL